MQTLAVNGYSAEQVKAALHAGTRITSFRYDLLDKYEAFKKALTTVASCTISHASLADIKRTAKIKIRDDGDIDFLSDRIQSFFQLWMPDGGFAEWSQGIFLLSSPDQYEENGKIYRDIDAYDGLQVLTDDKVDDRYAILAGTNYVIAVKTVLGSSNITKINIENSTLTLPVDRDWEPGTTKLALINDLLSSLNYIPLYVDEQGFYTSRKYVSPLYRTVDYTYTDDEFSVMHNGLVYGLDLFGTPNKFVRYTSNPDSTSLRSEYINDNPLSPLSTVRRGRTILDILKVNDIADQSTLDDLTYKAAFEASQKYGNIKVSTATMPMHSHNDLISINNSKLSIYGNFVETNWSMVNETGAKMTHVLRKVVTI